MDDFECIAAVTRHRDAADHLALAVQLGDSAPLVGPQFDARHVAQQHGRAALGLQHDPLDVLLAAQVAAAAHHVFALGHLDDAAADVAVVLAYGPHHRFEIDAIGMQLVRVGRDLVLLDESPHAGDLGHVVGLGQLVAHEPVLDRAQLAQIVPVAGQRVLVYPAHAGGIGPERRRHARGQSLRHGVQVLEHARARPVDVGAVLEDDVDEGRAEKREAAHHLRARHREHRGGQGIRDLVLDDLRTLPAVLGVQDDLHVREIRQRIQRRLQQRIHARADGAGREQQHQHDVAQRPVDQACQHLSVLRARRARSGPARSPRRADHPAQPRRWRAGRRGRRARSCRAPPSGCSRRRSGNSR
jgi:hypothetical protein